MPIAERYEILERLGAGSIGVVFRARDRENGREVALKTLRDPGPEDLYLLKREFRQLATIHHRNLVQLYDLEARGERAFFTLELIRGCDFQVWVCGSERGPARDWKRLRGAFAQLVTGLGALHARGKLHRDVKPHNVLVEPDGRVVLLDFGLVVGMDGALSQVSQREGFAGTLLYTSPEQAWGQPIGPPADLYSAGVMLYECLTGRLPFEGPGLGALLDRREAAPQPPRALVPGVPDDLEGLALDLLAYEPASRPEAAAILERLAVASAPAAVASPRRARRAAFVGREHALQQLRAAYAATRRGAASCLRIEGPSGIGKSTLLEHFVAALEAEESAVVLRARCHPQESVRFEALDGWVDELSRVLVHEPPERVEAIRPRGLAALLRVFPVLGRVPFVRPAAPTDLSDADPQEVRRRAFAALRELLARLAERRPLVLWSDDIQWGDADSAPFLRDLLRPPDPPPLLLLLSYRVEDRDASPLLAALDADPVASDPPYETLTVDPLAPEEARTLLESLLPDAGEPLRARARALADQTGGSPFFVAELARTVARRGAADLHDVDLGTAIRERLASLPAPAHQLLELVSVSGRPLGTRLALDLSGGAAQLLPRVYELWNESLLRASPTGMELETYHGRIRDAVLEGLAPEGRRRRHRQLAQALEADAEADPQALLEQWLGAGDRERAAPWALRSAEQAEAALAFERAAALYEQAWQLRGRSDADWELLEHGARALANASRASESARAYRAAAAAAEVHDSGGHAGATLRGRAAAQHFYCGELQPALEALESSLEAFGLRMPSGPRESARESLRNRARFLLRTRFRRLDLRLRPAEAIPPRDLARLEVLHGAAWGASMLDHTLSDALASRHLLDALDAGEPTHLIRALALEVGIESNLGGSWLRRRSEWLMGRVVELVEQCGDSNERARLELNLSNTDWMYGFWGRCVERGERGQALLREACVGAGYESSMNWRFALAALVQMGRLREVEARRAQLIADARSRSARHDLMNYGTQIWPLLARDDPEQALRDLAETGAEYPGSGLFTSQHFAYLHGAVYTDLYRGEPWVAWSRCASVWPALEESGFLRLDVIGHGLRHMRSSAALAALAAGPPPGADPRLSDWTAGRLLRVARRDVRICRRCTLRHGPALAAALAAGIAGARGREAERLAALERALAAYERSEMRLWAEGTRWQLGRLCGGAEGRALRARAEEWMQAQGVRDPQRFARTVAPIGSATE